MEKVPSECLSQTVTDAISHGFTHFAFLGGEPSIRFDFPKIIEPLQSGPLIESVMVISNMLSFNEPMVRAIFQTNAKHAQIVASIDLLNEPNYKNQNTARALSYVKKIQSIAKEYKDEGDTVREVHVHTVISRENYRNLVSHVEYFKGQNIDVSMAIVEPFELVSEIESFNQYNRFTRNEIKMIIDQLDVLENKGLLNWSNNVLREYLIKTLGGNLAYNIGCKAGHSHVIIESDGNVYPCLTESYRSGLKYGNIISERFLDIYQRMQAFHCEAPFQQTCWDHFLWTKMEKQVERPNQ